MNKKNIVKILVLLVVAGISVYIGLCFEPVNRKNIELSFIVDTYGMDSEKIQIYYANGENGNSDDFSEDKKIEATVSAENGYTVSAELPVTINKIRIDSDFDSDKTGFDSITLSYDGKVIDLSNKEWEEYDELHDAEILAVIDNNICIKTQGNDPFIVWNIESWKSDIPTSDEVGRYNIIIKAVMILVLCALYLVFLRYFDALIQFPAEIFYCKTLIMQLSKNDFKTRFAGSYLGIVWAFVQPVITIVLYWLVFEKAFHSTGYGNVPFALWLTAGLVPWFFFSEALMGGTTSLIEYQYLVKKVVFQIDILPVVKVFSSLYVHVFFVVFTIVVYTISGIKPSLFWLQVIYYSFCTIVFTTGLVFITSAIVGFFRDLTQIINILLQIVIWFTPIMWNYENMTLSKAFDIILHINPLFYIVQGYRDSLISHIGVWQRPGYTIYFWVITAAIWTAGTFVFRRLKVHFADVF